MYTFIDVNETSDGVMLPSEALRINGEYIENLIEGYRTLHVKGREALSPEIETVETGFRDGSIFRNRRFPARTITVTYQLVAYSNHAFREAFNKLAKVLNVEDAQLVFSDEADKYFIGTPSSIGEIEPGRNCVIGSFDIKCIDPFKYSLTPIEKTMTIVDEKPTATFNYNGTCKAYPQLECTFPAIGEGSEYGFVGYVNEREAMLQFGNPDEKDYTELSAKTFPLINNAFSSWGPWLHANASGATIGSRVQTGTAALANGALKASSYGTNATATHGPTVYCTPNWGTTGTGAQNFRWTIKQKFLQSKEAQYGEFQAIVVDSGNNILVGCLVRKSAKGTKCTVKFYANGEVFKTYTGIYCKNVTSTVIKKEGGKITISCAGKKASISPSGMSAKLGMKCIMFFGQIKGQTVIANNYVTSCKFEKLNCTYTKDIENTFQCGDVLVADTSEGRCYRNDIAEDSLGALGNDWEEFYLSPGQNTIVADFTGWKNGSAGTTPTFKVKYRERYL